ncbi:MAG: hypothetical protein HZA90_25525 [Verrucomicrobia bacterium]|nr:hypothetical protein [Verrucomicrobiota bacterium]
MNEEHLNAEDARLRTLLQRSRPAPPLPPRFREAVWRRIERQEPRATADSPLGWLDTLAEWLLRPRLALAGAAALLVAGAVAGVFTGLTAAKHEAQARYVAAVSPGP